MQRQIILDLVEGDDAPDLPVRFSGLNLSEYSSITMHLQRPHLARISRTVTPDIADPELGAVAWSSGDLIRGRSFAEFEFVRISDGKTFTLPQKYRIIVDVRRDLA